MNHCEEVLYLWVWSRCILPSHYDNCLKWITLQNGRAFYGTLSIGGSLRKYYYPMPRCSCPFLFIEPLTVCVPQQYWLLSDEKWWAIGGWKKQNLPHSTLIPLVLWCDAKQFSQVSAFAFIDCNSLGNALGSKSGTISSDCPFCGIPEQTWIFLGTRKVEWMVIAN